jgi:DNA repair protein RecN (Recombination protein N)
MIDVAGIQVLKKHSVNTTNQLLAIRDGLAAKAKRYFNIGEAIAQKDKAVQDLLRRL